MKHFTFAGRFLNSSSSKFNGSMVYKVIIDDFRWWLQHGSDIREWLRENQVEHEVVWSIIEIPSEEWYRMFQIKYGSS